MENNYPFKTGDIINFRNNYYGLIVSAKYRNSYIWLEVLNTNSNVRQLNLTFLENHNYAYKVINI
tara:strand:- start:42 stop:236 length:195 start_codon:yes stop_codon:yes gene_type:complete